MADIASLILKVDAQQVDKGTQSLSDLQKQAQKTEQAAVKLGKEIGTTLAVGITTAGTATFMLVRNAINAADAMNDLNLKTGIAFKNLAAYDLLARQSGTSIEGVAQSFKFLGKYMVEHSDKLEYIGVTSKDSTAAMGQFADAIAGIKDPTLRTAVAMEVLGRSGAEMLPMLSGGSEAFKKAQEQTKAYGDALERVAPKADEFNDGISRMEIAGKVVGLTLAEKLLPTLLAVSDAMLESSVNSGLVEKWGTSLAWILKGVAVTAINVAYVLTQIGNEIGGIAAQAAAFLTGNFSEAKRIGQMMKADAAAARIEVDKMTDSILNAEDAKKKDTAAAGEQSKSMDEYARRLLQGNEAADKARKAEDSRQKSIADMIESLEKEAATFGKTTAQIKLYELALLKASPAQVKAAQAALDRVDALQREKDAKESIVKAEADYLKSINDDTESIVENNKKMMEHIGNIGKTKEEIANLASERENSAIKIAEETLATSDAIGIHNAETEALRENIKARKDRRDLFSQTAVAEGLQAEKKATEKHWKEIADTASNTMKGAWDSIFEKGKSTWASLRDSIKKVLLDYIWSAFEKPLTMNVVASIAGTVGASGLAQAAGVAGGGGEGLSLSSIGTAMSVAGSTFGTGALTALTNGAGIMGNLSAAGSLVGTGTAGGIGAGIGMMAPYAVAALVVAQAAGLFKKGGGPKVGDYGIVGEQGYKPIAGGASSGGDPLGIKKLTENLYSQVKILESISGKKFDNLTIQQGYDFDPEGTAGNRGSRQIRVGGQILQGASGGGASQFWDTAEAGAKALSVLNTSDLQALIKELGDPKLSAAADALMRNFGELEKSLPAYLTAQETQKNMMYSLMSETEKTAEKTKQLDEAFKAIGMSVPANVESFKSLVSSIDVTTEAGQKQIAGLNQLGNAFLELHPAIEQSTADAEKLAQQSLELSQQMSDVSMAMDEMNMSPLEKSLNDIAKATSTAIEKATKLSATEEQLSKVRELGAKQAQAIISASAASAYTNLMSATGDNKGATQFTAGIAEGKYNDILGQLAESAGIKSIDAQAYIESQGGITKAVKAYWDELDAAMVSATDPRRTLLIQLTDAAAEMANAQSAANSAAIQSSTVVQEQTNTVIDNSAAIQLAAQRRQLEISLMEAQGNVSGALTERRKDELAAMDDSLRGIQSSIWAAQDAAIAAEKSSESLERTTQANKAATDSAMDSYRKAIDAQKKIAQVTIDTAREQVDSITSVMDAVSDGVKTLRGQVTSTVMQSGASGMKFIADALSTARTSGYLPDAKELQDAISSATTGLDSKLYTSKVDADRDRLRLAGQLEQIGEIGGDQLTNSEKALRIAEDQLKALDDQLVAAQTQIDVMRGVNNSVLSISAAISALSAAISAEKQAMPQVSAMAPMASVSSSSPAVDYTIGGTNYAAQSLLGITGMSAAAAASHISNVVATSDAATAAAISGYAHQAGIPGFAVGSNYVPFDMTAKIHAGEEITPRPFVDIQRESREETNALLARLVSSNDEMRAELKAVKLELADIKNTNKRMMQTNEKWDIDGIPAERTA